MQVVIPWSRSTRRQVSGPVRCEPGRVKSERTPVVDEGNPTGSTMLRSDSTTATSMNGNVVRTKPLDAMYVVGPVQRIAELRVNRQQSSAEDPDSIHCTVAPSS